jgi:hypothetical protein
VLPFIPDLQLEKLSVIKVVERMRSTDEVKCLDVSDINILDTVLYCNDGVTVVCVGSLVIVS